MQRLLEQAISKHPLFPNIDRKVVVYDVNIQGRFEQIVLDAEVHYFDENGKDITAMFNSKLTGWVVNNNDFTTVRDEKGNAVRNPDYVALTEGEEDLREEHQKEEYLKMPSFDYFFNIIKNPKAPSLINILQLHIVHNDAIKFFDKMLNIPVEP